MIEAMKKIFKQPELTVVRVSNTNVIVTSMRLHSSSYNGDLETLAPDRYGDDEF
ncbi:MAG: hypothetical protein IKO26_05980 [Paludibacteraceae bacterium]|nr:hypothetical protein [Paludibacteraceae bacterium]